MLSHRSQFCVCDKHLCANFTVAYWSWSLYHNLYYHLRGGNSCAAGNQGNYSAEIYVCENKWVGEPERQHRAVAFSFCTWPSARRSKSSSNLNLKGNVHKFGNNTIFGIQWAEFENICCITGNTIWFFSFYSTVYKVLLVTHVTLESVTDVSLVKPL